MLSEEWRHAALAGEVPGVPVGMCRVFLTWLITAWVYWESAVPTVLRDAVTLQVVPDLEREPLLLGAGDDGAVPPAAVVAAADAWRAADSYYLRSIGRIQRLWEVCVPVTM